MIVFNCFWFNCPYAANVAMTGLFLVKEVLCFLRPSSHPVPLSLAVSTVPSGMSTLG
jgi:hypothetical protein